MPSPCFARVISSEEVTYCPVLNAPFRPCSNESWRMRRDERLDGKWRGSRRWPLSPRPATRQKTCSKSPIGPMPELVDGELVEPRKWAKNLMGSPRQFLESLWAFTQTRKLGRVQRSQCGYQIFQNKPGGKVRIPDVSFIRQERLPTEGSSQGAFENCARSGRRGDLTQ